MSGKERVLGITADRFGGATRSNMFWDICTVFMDAFERWKWCGKLLDLLQWKTVLLDATALGAVRADTY